MRRALGIIICVIGVLVVVYGLAIVIFADAETWVGQLIGGGVVVLLGLFVTATGWFLRPPPQRFLTARRNTMPFPRRTHRTSPSKG